MKMSYWKYIFLNLSHIHALCMHGWAFTKRYWVARHRWEYITFIDEQQQQTTFYGVAGLLQNILYMIVQEQSIV